MDKKERQRDKREKREEWIKKERQRDKRQKREEWIEKERKEMNG